MGERRLRLEKEENDANYMLRKTRSVCGREKEGRHRDFLSKFRCHRIHTLSPPNSLYLDELRPKAILAFFESSPTLVSPEKKTSTASTSPKRTTNTPPPRLRFHETTKKKNERADDGEK